MQVGRRRWLVASVLATSAALGVSGRAHAAVPQAKTLLLQTASTWLPGDRIRVTTPGPTRARFAGWYSTIEADSVLRMRLTRSDPPVPVHLRQIGILETQVGRKRHVLAGAALGCLVGTLIGAAVAASDEDPEVRIDGLGTVRLKGLRQNYILIGAGSGLVLGGAIGLFVRTDSWGFATHFD
jgi:hypothetical protein